ncbi:MAG: topoisomerase C-terminal repeat-containing protein, partial [Prevotella sp.]
AKVELDFDKIAEGKIKWEKMMKSFDKDFEPTVEKAINQRSEHKAGERELGKDPKTGKPIFVKIGRYGPVIQLGAANEKEKPMFAHMPKELSMESITLEQALDLFKLPRMLGEYEGEPVTVGTGRFGPYVLHKKLYVSLPKDCNPMSITIGEAVKLIDEKRHEEERKHLRVFTEDMDLEVLNGRYGPYICYKGKNYRLPKAMHEKARELSYEEAMTVVNKSNS